MFTVWVSGSGFTVVLSSLSTQRLERRGSVLLGSFERVWKGLRFGFVAC